MDFNHYFTNEELDTILHNWAAQHPNLVTLSALGQSHEGRSIPLVTLTNQATGADTEKAAIWLDANIHATEIAGTTTVLAIAYTLLSGYGSDPRCTRLLDSATFYIAPRLNPDGAALAMAEKPRYLRSGTRPYPEEERAPGLHAEDIDDDGRILQMRIEDPNGEWKISSLDPRLMQLRGPDEHEGIFYRLFPEGRIEEFDGQLVKMARPFQGLDFNRNFPFEWQPDSVQQGAGPYPTSEPEIQATVAFITSHPNINIAVTYHTYSGVILRPFSTRADDQLETDDLWVYQKMGERGKELTGYPCVSVYHDFRYHPKEVTTGAFDDWVYDFLGIFAFTVELWDLRGKAGIEVKDFIGWFRNHPHEEDLKILRWLEEHGGEGAVVDWYAFEHPQLGKVEIGGFNRLFTWSNPPLHWMGEEAERNVPFALSLADMLPRLEVRELSVEAVGEEIYRLRLVVENSGFLPTYTSAQGRKRKASRPLRVKLGLPEGVSLKVGKARTELGHLEGRSHRLDVSSGHASSPTDNRAWAEWIVKGPAGAEIQVEILGERAGKQRHRVSLGA
jgi:murein tripeptide amidase MpaA